MKARDFFEKLDKNGDGKVSKMEFRQVASRGLRTRLSRRRALTGSSARVAREGRCGRVLREGHVEGSALDRAHSHALDGRKVIGREHGAIRELEVK